MALLNLCYSFLKAILGTTRTSNWTSTLDDYVPVCRCVEMEFLF